MITDHIFDAFLACPTKAYLLANDPSDVDEAVSIIELSNTFSNTHKQRCKAFLSSRNTSTRPSNRLSREHHAPNRILFDQSIVSQDLACQLDALEIASLSDNQIAPKIPIRFVERNKLTKSHKLLVAFDALVMSLFYRATPIKGRIIYGEHLTR